MASDGHMEVAATFGWLGRLGDPSIVERVSRQAMDADAGKYIERG